MQNHPHDSICGCSIDQVHREMMPRFEQVEQIADELTKRALISSPPGSRPSEDSLVVFNPLNWTRTDRVTAIDRLRGRRPGTVRSPYDASRDVESIRLFDDTGKEVPIAIQDSRADDEADPQPVRAPAECAGQKVHGRVSGGGRSVVRLPDYRIEKSAEKPAAYPGPSLVVGENAMSNEFLRLSVCDGSVRVERTDSQLACRSRA